VQNASSGHPFLLGNVITGGTPDSDPDGDSLTITGITKWSLNELDHEVNVSSVQAIGNNQYRIWIQNDGVALVNVASNGDVTMWAESGDPFKGLGVGESLNITFSYNLSDGHGGTASAQGTITVTGTNDGPVANGYFANIYEDTGISAGPGGIMVVDSDDGGERYPNLTAILVDGPQHAASFVLNPDGSYTYVPEANWFGTDTITYKLRDIQGLESNVATYTFNVASVNDVPFARSDNGNLDPAFAMTEDTGTKTFNVLANDVLDADAGAPNNITIGAISFASANSLGLDPSDLKVTVDANNQIQVQLLGSDWDKMADGDVINVRIAYSIHGDQPSDVATSELYLRVTGVNDPPVLNGVTLNAVEGGTVTFAPGDLNVTDPDVAGGRYDVTEVTGGKFQILTNAGVWVDSTWFLGGGAVRFIDDGDNVAPTFKVSFWDGYVSTPVITGTVNFTPTEDGVGTVSVTGTAHVGQTLTAVFADNDPDGAASNVTYQWQRDGVNISSATASTYLMLSADDGHQVSVTVAYKDGQNFSETISALAPNNPPDAVDDDRTAVAGYSEDVKAIFQASNLLANDSDPDGHALSVTSVQGATHGTVAMSNGTITFAPDANYNGAASFTYTVSDGHGGTDTATVSFNLAPVNDAATIDGTAIGSVTEDVTLTAGGTLAVHDIDSGQNLFQAPASLVGTYGTFSFDANSGAWGYTLDDADPIVQALNAGDTRHDTLTVTSADGTAHSTIDVAIHGFNEPAPLVINDTAGAEGRYAASATSPFLQAPTTLSFDVASLFGGGHGIVSYDSQLIYETGDDSWLQHSGSQFSGHPTDANFGFSVFQVTATDSVESVSTYVVFSALESGAYSLSVTSDSANPDPSIEGSAAWVLDMSDGFNDLITVAIASNTVEINGGGGDDVLIGSAGANNLNGGDGNDVLYGLGGNDTLKGGNGTDYLDGGAGNDILTGGAGGDYLLGGSGADTFWISAPTEGLDHILDFRHAEGDIIELLASAFGLAPGADVGAMFGSDNTANAQSAGERFHFDTANHTLYYDADGSGTAVASIALARLENGATLIASDIHLA
jgi:VCBS repeat-containing protein